MRKKWHRLMALSLGMLLSLSGCTSGTALPEETAPAETQTVMETPAPSVAPTPDASDVGKLRLSELMLKNRATLCAADGQFYDWVEIENCSDETVSLSGWTLSDGESKDGWALPDTQLVPGDHLLIFAAGKDAAAGYANFSLSAGETLCLFTPSGALADATDCLEAKADIAQAWQEVGFWELTAYATPGYANDAAGYEAFCAAQSREGPLQINEVMASNLSYARQNNAGYTDWVEIRNVSDEDVLLSDYWLSDSASDYYLWHFPEVSLRPGALFTVYCSGDESYTAGDSYHAPFKLDANADRLFLSTADGLADYVYLHDIPVNGSCGRIEGQSGFFYFTAPTPGYLNGEGFRRVTATPWALEPDGVYEDVECVSVNLEGRGTVYYTTDGTVPTERSAVLDRPITLFETSIVRAIAVEDGQAPSRVLTLSYIINEHHDLPVLSLVADDYTAFRGMYSSGYVNQRIPCVLSLYEEDGGGFTNAGGLGLAGAGTRTKYPKKSLSIKFSGKYGDGDLEYDLFDTGITDYDAVTLHVGEDYVFAVIRTDLFQNLALEMSDDVVAQHSKYCALYINGQYYGLYCLKERWTQQFYASLMGVSEESVEILKYPVELTSSFNLEVIKFCRENDMSLPENYEHFCELVNVDSLIDWFLLEGLAGNPDIGGNMRVLRTTEGEDTRWRFGLYDLDWSMQNASSVFYTFLSDNDYHYGQIYAILSALFKNEDFRDRLLTRYAEVYDTVLSNESFIAHIDAMADEIRSEMPRERAVWGSDTNRVDQWEVNLDKMRHFVLDNDLQRLGVEHLCKILGLTDEERAAYFGW